MPEFNRNLWAPWRLPYVKSLGGQGRPGCFLCHYRDAPEQDVANGVIWRTATVVTLLNKFPYTNGHLLVAPLAHKAELSDLSPEEMAALMGSLRDATQALSAVLSPQGFNVGINFGRCAGAGLPDHLHFHLVPRWNGDTNFMSIVGNSRVIPQALEQLTNDLRRVAAEQGLPAPLRPPGS